MLARFGELSLLDIDSHIDFVCLVEDFLARGVPNHLQVPADELAHEELKVLEVLSILVDQVTIADLPLLVLSEARLVLVNLRFQLFSHRKGVVLLNTECSDVYRCSWVDLLLELLQVVACKVEVCFQARLLY